MSINTRVIEQIINNVVLEAPAIEPVDLDEFKEFARIDTVHDDNVLTTLLISARELTEKFLSRSLIKQKRLQTMDFWPPCAVDLMWPNLLSVERVYSVDEEGVETLLDPSSYYADSDKYIPTITVKTGLDYPESDRPSGGIRIEYYAGYGENKEDVPSAIRSAIMAIAASAFDDPEASSEIPPITKSELNIYRILSI